MVPAIREIEARSALTRTGIPGFSWCLNPYVGCAHACAYCYATFMKRFTGHAEAWGDFVDARVNLPAILRRELARRAPGPVLLSSVTDPYQPLEERYRLTRGCLEELTGSPFPVSILTKSPLVLGDLDLLRRIPDLEVGLTVTTDNDRVRRLFEPHAPPIARRIEALRTLREAGIATYVFIGPLLPQDPRALAALLGTVAARALIDPMNYPSKTRRLYRSPGLQRWLEEGTIAAATEALKEGLRSRGVAVD